MSAAPAQERPQLVLFPSATSTSLRPRARRLSHRAWDASHLVDAHLVARGLLALNYLAEGSPTSPGLEGLRWAEFEAWRQLLLYYEGVTARLIAERRRLQPGPMDPAAVPLSAAEHALVSRYRQLPDTDQRLVRRLVGALEAHASGARVAIPGGQR